MDLFPIRQAAIDGDPALRLFCDVFSGTIAAEDYGDGVCVDAIGLNDVSIDL